LRRVPRRESEALVEANCTGICIEEQLFPRTTRGASEGSSLYKRPTHAAALLRLLHEEAAKIPEVLHENYADDRPI
jgi:hypothetical protein